LLYKNIPIANTGQYTKLVLDYVQQHDAVKPFYQYPPTMQAFGEVIANRSFEQSKREVLVATLLKQYAEIGVNPKQAKAVFANIESLKDSNTFTVTTGHQLALFTGPLFFIYKILSTIRLAEELRIQHPTKQFVPVFWMASEDHDFAEINHVFVNGKKIEWTIDSQNHPVGVLPTEAIQATLQILKQELGASNVLLEVFEKAYAESPNLSIATRKIVHQLFADRGLVILEPNDVELKKQFIPVMLDDVLKHTSFQALIDTNGRLGRNYKLQITGREINFFYLGKEGRNLLKKTKKGFELNTTETIFTEEEIKTEINKHPERFSPNVVLRPVYQECILPNLGYIGGPGELAYWLQLKDVFAVHQVPFPMIVLRNSVMLLRKAILHKLEKRGVKLEQLFLKEEELIKQFVSTEHTLSIDDNTIVVEQSIQQAIDAIMPFDNQIASKLIDWKMKAMDELHQLKKEIYKSKKAKSDADIQLLLSIKQELFPNNEPQERHNTLAQFTGDYYASFIELVGTHLMPLSNTLDVLFWD
jgi:bacillithiol synthase